jgi:hypothetical protein
MKRSLHKHKLTWECKLVGNDSLKFLRNRLEPVTREGAAHAFSTQRTKGAGWGTRCAS